MSGSNKIGVFARGAGEDAAGEAAAARGSAAEFEVGSGGGVGRSTSDGFGCGVLSKLAPNRGVLAAVSEEAVAAAGRAGVAKAEGAGDGRGEGRGVGVSLVAAATKQGHASCFTASSCRSVHGSQGARASADTRCSAYAWLKDCRLTPEA